MIDPKIRGIPITGTVCGLKGNEYDMKLIEVKNLFQEYVDAIRSELDKFESAAKEKDNFEDIECLWMELWELT